MMHFYVVVLCVTVVLHEGKCEVLPREPYSSIMKKTSVQIKRQSDPEDCVMNKLDETIKDSSCKLAVVTALYELGDEYLGQKYIHKLHLRPTLRA